MKKEHIDFRPYEFYLIDNKKYWCKALDLIKLEPKIGIDIEANNDGELQEICLIQLSIRGFDFIIDPLANFDFDELGEILQSKEFLKIFHGSDYDLRLLWNQYNWKVNNLFDTMWAGKILGEKQVGLVNALDRLLNVTHDKKYQCSNWRKRPLTKKQLEYASRDSHYLIPLQERLEELLTEKNILDEAKEYFEELSLEAILTSENDLFSDFTLFQNLPKHNYLVFKKLCKLREEIANSKGLYPTQIIPNKCLFQISTELPITEQQLEKIKDIKKSIKHIPKREILEVVEKSITSPDIDTPNNQKDISNIKKRIKNLTELRKMLSKKSNIESELIMTKNKIFLLAFYAPKNIEDLKKLNFFGPIRLTKYGSYIIDTLTK
ncbi:MAG: HRDC domain-containing protein [Candidatus Hydrogenedentes bacterium]|nr:HRDC domain-containing protein [Candidatus Hydrogenedentota bacterium]